MTEINWIPDLDRASRRAGETGRFVLLDFFSPT
jgi:hypothetical protein